jgi:hypothetical protein
MQGKQTLLKIYLIMNTALYWELMCAAILCTDNNNSIRDNYFICGYVELKMYLIHLEKQFNISVSIQQTEF